MNRFCPANIERRDAALSRFPALKATGEARQEGSMGQLVKHLRCFRNDDTGAVTIDWVALTSAILLLGIMVVYAIFNGGVSTLVSNINSTLTGVNTGVNVGAAPNLNSSFTPEPKCCD